VADPLLRVFVRGEESAVPPVLWSGDDIGPVLSALVHTNGTRDMWVIIVGAPGVPDGLCAVHSVWVATPPPVAQIPVHGRVMRVKWPQEPVRFPRA
jgi:hypothetical protein